MDLTFLYALFQNLIGQDLYNFLAGTAGASPQNHFTMFGVVMLIISLLGVAIYYLILDHPRFATKAVWGMFMASFSLIQALIAWLWLEILVDQMVGVDIATGSQYALNIYRINFMGMAFAQAFLGTIVFFVLSCGFKLISNNAPHIPFYTKL